MRVWDLPAGYLNRQSLLGEHRELHGIYSILTNKKSGHANHPETVRWVRTRSGLATRHRQLVAEMSLRGYVDRTPIRISTPRAKCLRDTPDEGRLTNALEHMWGHVRDHATRDDVATARVSLGHMLATTQRLAGLVREPFLLSSTALSELAIFIDDLQVRAG
jgi:hypothetical protein